MMKAIFSIYGNDLKRIASNWAALIMTAGLILLPSFYAWFNIKASWDPYGHTDQIKVAVTNLDEGSEFQGKEVNLGERILSTLRKNDAFHWQFVNKEKAINGVQHGDFYARMEIPKDFSEKMATVVSDQPVQPEIIYSVNEKINPIAPKITNKGAETIIDRVSSNFVKEATKAIFKEFNKLGIKLEEELPTIQKLESLIFKLEGEFPELKKILTTAAEDADQSQRLVNDAQKQLPIAADLSSKGLEVTESVQDVLKKSEKVFQELPEAIKSDLGSLQDLFTSLEGGADQWKDREADPAVLEDAGKRLSSAALLAGALADMLTRLNEQANSTLLDVPINRLKEIQSESEQEEVLVKKLSAITDQAGREKQAEVLKNRLADTRAKAGELNNTFDSSIQPKIQEALDQAQKSADQADSILLEINTNIPDVKKILSDAEKGLSLGENKVAEFQKELPQLEKKIGKLADDIRTFKETNNINNLIELLQNNAEKESSFFSNPVKLKQERMFPIPNYGSALAPFYTALSLWVGCVLLVSLLSVEIHEEHHYRSMHVYFGRFLTFWTIGLFQALIVAAGNVYILGVYAVHPGWLILFSLLISTIFMLIVYSLVSVFGNIGKAFAIIMLVLQLAGSGGTFPIQVTPPFFQAINPFLPFTYAISLLREAIGGILWDIVIMDAARIIIYGAAAILFGVFLKKPINKASEGFRRKLAESKLIH
ncbi:YhgE/Pip domain-containing protein [Metabacillus sp. KIGAM252]|uniref:YhgE/Pip domain-containing protein n=1 Tax=Metabacillus flavus TaxID=2823519 RepID=A0ABS5LCN0_9BACI|nr:YhgE/Pip domain-containing protein [Metabacillus flavus]MBS2968490.1 YhgE/Pip domain-containing protein [Metabacillus flavus]